MRTFLIRVVINAITIAVVASLLPGIRVLNDSIGTLLIIGLVFGTINAILKPILLLISLPFVILSLGFFVLVINACMLSLTASLLPNRLQVDGFLPALIAGVCISIVTAILERVFGIHKSDENGDDKQGSANVIYMERRK
jgi:putative membrane protein